MWLCSAGVKLGCSRDYKKPCLYSLYAKPEVPSPSLPGKITIPSANMELTFLHERMYLLNIS